jgi:hypothetical protein
MVAPKEGFDQKPGSLLLDDSVYLQLLILLGEVKFYM